MADQDIAARFARDAEHHRMAVLHDDGLYRHLRFRAEKTSSYWFDLITVPGVLIFRGDGPSFVFARLPDMFEFFRGPVGQIHPGYWLEKLTSDSDRIRRYDPDVFTARVKAAFVEAARDGGVPAGAGRALRERVLDEVAYTDERGAHELLADFEHDGFRFYDTSEWDFRDYDWWFLWALHGIVWGISQYDAHGAVSGAQDPGRAA